ncbi:MAG: ArgE/DapE family deacylase [Candidatus Zipacnadales bacterium]
MSDLPIAELNAVVDGYTDFVLETLPALIRFPSTQGQEQEVQAYVKDLFAECGWPGEYREIPNSLFEDEEYSHGDFEQSYTGRYNFVAKRKGTGGGRSVILQTHSDVVPGGEWKEAFEPVIRGDTIIGRGATDCKGQIVTMLCALRALDALGVKVAGDVECQIVIEEEVGGNGALALIRQGCSADGVIVMEGTDLQIHPANRGAIWFRATTYGKSLHMGRRHEGVNAIEKMVEVIQLLLDYEKRLIAASQGQPLFAKYDNPVQLCLGTIRADGWPSMVAGECVLEGGVGFLPNMRMADIKQDLWDTVMQSDDEWLKTHFKLEFPKLHNDAYEIPADHPLPITLYQACRALGLNSEVFGWNVSCDARLYKYLADLPTVVFGPSDIRQAHAAGESVTITEILTGAKALALSLIRWCGI